MRIEDKDLRIGNLVNRKCFNPQPNNENWQLEPVEIFALGFGKYNVKLKNGGHSVIDYVEPIPLTEEWLIRFGFEKHSLNPYWFNKGIICISIVHKVELISWDRQIFKLDIEINHVHQLQNLYFALTNTELECNSK